MPAAVPGGVPRIGIWAEHPSGVLRIVADEFLVFTQVRRWLETLVDQLRR